MDKLKYKTHLLLNSKYRLFIHLFIISLFYLCIYGDNIIYCMNGSNNLVEAPTSQTSHSQSEDLRREITAYVGSHVSLLEEIDRKNEYLQHLLQISKRKSLEIIELRKQNGALGHKIHDLREDIANLEDEANSFYDAYKKQCKISGRLGNQVGDLKQELREKNAEISQLRSSVKLLGDSLATRK